jgi:hypothetical protein
VVERRVEPLDTQLSVTVTPPSNVALRSRMSYEPLSPPLMLA